MSSAMVSLGIATGYERRYGVLKRLGLDAAVARRAAHRQDAQRARARGASRRSLIVAHRHRARLGSPPAASSPRCALLLVGTVAFAGIGMLLAGTLRAEANLAVANGLFLVLLFLGGMAYPLAKLPDALQTFAKALPGGRAVGDGAGGAHPGRVVPDRRAGRAPGVGGRRTPRRRPLVPLGRVENVPRRPPRLKSSPPRIQRELVAHARVAARSRSRVRAGLSDLRPPNARRPQKRGSARSGRSLTRRLRPSPR